MQHAGIWVTLLQRKRGAVNIFLVLFAYDDDDDDDDDNNNKLLYIEDWFRLIFSVFLT
jgi:hypothetical protein